MCISDDRFTKSLIDEFLYSVERQSQVVTNVKSLPNILNGRYSKNMCLQSSSKDYWHLFYHSLLLLFMIAIHINEGNWENEVALLEQSLKSYCLTLIRFYVCFGLKFLIVPNSHCLLVSHHFIIFRNTLLITNF